MKNKSTKAPVEAQPVKNAASKPAVTVTGAPALSPAPSPSAPVIVHGAHVESRQAAEQKNPDVAAEASVPLSLLDIARLAWDGVKDISDPDFDHCVATHKEKYLSHAQSIINGSAPQSGDTRLAQFEQAVSRINKEKS